MALLAEIAEISDDALIAWERLVSGFTGELLDLERVGLTASGEWLGLCQYQIWDAKTQQFTERSYHIVSYRGRFMAVWVPEAGTWVARETGVHDVNLLDARVIAAIQAAEVCHGA